MTVSKPDTSWDDVATTPFSRMVSNKVKVKQNWDVATTNVAPVKKVKQKKKTSVDHIIMLIIVLVLHDSV